MNSSPNLAGWQMQDEANVKFFLYVNGAVLLTDALVLMGLRYVTSLSQDETLSAPEQIQLGLDSGQARRLAELLLDAANQLDQVPSSKPLAW